MAQVPDKTAIYPIFDFQISGTSTVSDSSVKSKANIFQFSNKVVLRLIEKEELDRFLKTLPYLFGDGANLLYLVNPQTYVFELRGNIDRADRLIYQVLLAMRLHKIGSVFCKIARFEEDSKTIQVRTIYPPAPWRHTKYIVDLVEFVEIDKLVIQINKLDLDKNNSFRVACERFSRSFEERREDDKIIDLAIAFESLFSDEDTSKLEHMGKFVGLGSSMLLGRNSEERKEINQFLLKAFSLRNKIVHNNEIKSPIEVNGKKLEMSDFSKQLQNYLRETIKKLI